MMMMMMMIMTARKTKAYIYCAHVMYQASCSKGNICVIFMTILRNWHHYPYFTDEEEEATVLKGCRSDLNRNSLNLTQELTL